MYRRRHPNREANERFTVDPTDPSYAYSWSETSLTARAWRNGQLLYCLPQPLQAPETRTEEFLKIPKNLMGSEGEAIWKIEYCNDQSNPHYNTWGTWSTGSSGTTFYPYEDWKRMYDATFAMVCGHIGKKVPGSEGTP